MGSIAVYYVFRIAPARQRVAVADKDQPLVGVRGESALVRRGNVSDLAIRVRHDDERFLSQQSKYLLVHFRGRHGVFHRLRLSNV